MISPEELAALKRRLEIVCESLRVGPMHYLSVDIHRLIAEVEHLSEVRECLSHALALGCFTPGGSTEGWAKRVLNDNK